MAFLSPVGALLDRNPKGTPESREAERLKKEAEPYANKTLVGAGPRRPPGTSTLTGGLGLNDKQGL